MDIVKSAFGAVTGVPLRTYAEVLGGTAVAVLIAEHVGRKYQSTKRPSVALAYSADKCQKFFQWLGEQFAWASSYLTQLDLKDVGVTLYDVGKPTVDLMLSPFYSIYGYLKRAMSYQNKSWLVYVGSGLLTTLALAGWYRLSYTWPQLNIWSPAYNFTMGWLLNR